MIHVNQPFIKAAAPFVALSAIFAAAVVATLAWPSPAAGAGAAVTGFTLSSDSPGTFKATWDAPDQTPTDYRLNWAKSDQDFPSWRDDHGNLYPIENSDTVPELDEGVEYKVRVRARYRGSQLAEGQLRAWSTPWSDVKRVTIKSTPPAPAAPANLIGTTSHDRVVLSWDDPQDDTITGYQILRRDRSEAASQFTAIHDDTGSSATTYTDTAVTSQATYSYQVKARNAGGLSPASNAFDADLPAPPAPSAPTGLIAFATHDAVTFNWDDPSDDTITGYQIQRALVTDDVAGAFAVVVDDTAVAGTSYIDADVSAETGYAYLIKARNTGGLSPASAETIVMTAGVPVIEEVPPLDPSDQDPPLVAGNQESTVTDRAALMALYNATDGANWNNNTNWGSQEPLADWHGVQVHDGRVVRLLLAGNNLRGAIPVELGNLSRLLTLHLSRNQLTGSIPAALGNLDGLDFLYLDRNRLTGSLPTELGGLQSLQELALDDNQLTGPIPASFGRLGHQAGVVLHQFDVLHLHNNDLSGVLPAELGNLPSLDDLKLHNNPGLKGDIPDNFRSLLSLGELEIQNTGITVPDSLDSWIASVDVVSMGTNPSVASLDLDSDNGSPRGAWSDRETLWVVDSRDKKMYAYTLANGARAVDKDIILASDNTSPYGVWSNGETLWVTDSGDNKLYAYTLSDGTRNSDRDIELTYGRTFPFRYNVEPRGLWSDGETIWVSDSFEKMGFAYSLSDGNRDPDKEIYFSLAFNGSPRGMTSDRETIWVADELDDRLYAYDVATGDRIPDKAMVLDPDNTSPAGIWSDWTTMWVVDSEDRKVYAYGPPPVPLVQAKNEPDECRINRPHGMWTDGTTMYVADERWKSQPDKVWAYSLATGLPVSDQDIEIGTDFNVRGVWSDSETLWVVHYPNWFANSDDTPTELTAFSLATRERDESKTFPLHRNNLHPVGLSKAGGTLWVGDIRDRRVYAYDITTQKRVPNRDVSLTAGGGNLVGVWTDGVTLWATDYEDKKLYAYDVARNARVRSADIVLEPDNTWPVAIASDGTTMWVSDVGDCKLYTYTLPSR